MVWDLKRKYVIWSVRLLLTPAFLKVHLTYKIFFALLKFIAFFKTSPWEKVLFVKFSTSCSRPKSRLTCRETEYNKVRVDTSQKPQNCAVSIMLFLLFIYLFYYYCFFGRDHRSMISVLNPCSLPVTKSKCPIERANVQQAFSGPSFPRI